MKRQSILASIAFAAALCAASAACAVSFTYEGGKAYGRHFLLNATLGLSGKGRVTYTYAGAHAGYHNGFEVNGVALFDNRTSTRGAHAAFTLDGGKLDFGFTTARPAFEVANGTGSGVHGGIAFYKLSDTSVYALFNDTYRGDRDFNDLAVRMDVAPVPLPAAAGLLIGSLGLLGATAWRRHTAPV